MEWEDGADYCAEGMFTAGLNISAVHLHVVICFRVDCASVCLLGFVFTRGDDSRRMGLFCCVVYIAVYIMSM